MAQKVVNKALGLYSFKNNLTVPDGAMSKADDIIIDRDGIVEKRRGFGLYNSFGDSTDRSKQLLQYKNKLLVHYNTTLMYEQADGTFAQFDGVYTETEAGLRIKSLETSGNLLITTSEGVKKISATSSNEFSTAAGYITDAGAVRALDVELKANYTTGGFFAANSIVAYRVVWGYTDNNNNLILGYPSETAVLTNPDPSNSCTVNLTIGIPSEITSTNPLGYFYQVYRSSQKSPYTSANDTEFQMVLEEFPDSVDITAGSVTTNDITPDDFRDGGALLYTNEISGEGILQANSRPPLAKDLEYFKGSTFYANTSTRHNKILNLISVSNMISDSTKIIVADVDQVTEYTFRGVAEVSTLGFAPYTFNLPDFNGTYFFTNAANNSREYAVWYDITGADPIPTDGELAGKILVKVDINAAISNADIITATQTILDGYIDFDVTGSATVLTIENSTNGNSTDTQNSINNPIPALIDFAVSPQGLGEDAGTNKILLSSDPSVGVQIDESARSMVRIVNKNTSEIVNASYLSSTEDVPGSMNFERKDSLDTPFYMAVNQANIADNFNPTLPVAQTGKTLTITSSLGEAAVTSTAHGLVAGDKVGLYASTVSNAALLGVKTVKSATVNEFIVEIAQAGDPTGTISYFKASEVSDNEIKPNRLYYSKDGIPEAVPTLNYFDVGAKDQGILRVVALRDSLFILKKDGIYRLSGSNSSNFNVVLFDNSSPLIAPDSPAVLNNQIYMLSTQGVITVTDSGVNVVSRNIEDLVLEPTSNNFASFDTQCFGLASETDRSYYMFLPTETDDTTATQCFRYNVFTSAWTRWNMGKTCGLTNTSDNKIYFGAADINYIEQERKNFQRTDYADRDSANSINSLKSDVSLEVANISGIAKFDAVYQEQYITIARFNRLLDSLDADPSLVYGGASTDYATEFNAANGADLATLLAALIVRLSTDDATTTYTASSGSIVNTDIRDDFNVLTAELNVSTGIFYVSYPTYTEIVKYEATISETTVVGNLVTILTATPFIVGAIIIYKAIPSSFEYVPENLGDSSLLKHFREATLMFDDYAFTFGEMGFRSDVSASLEPQLFPGDGNGDYGTPGYGDAIYGGGSNQRPFRTYVPRNKQRCRFIIVTFNHDAARENFSLLGYSVTYADSTSERAYKN